MKTKRTKWFDSAIIKEDELKTTANAKHFILNNGTRKAVFSPHSTNYFDASEKKWKPIDNTLKTAEDGYLAKIGAYTARLSKKSDNEAVELTNGSDVISWEYLGVNKTVFSMPASGSVEKSAKRKSKLKVKSKIHDALNLVNASRATYENAEGNIDIDYLIEGNGIKENIIVKDKSESYRYYFLLRIAGFKMKSAEDSGDIEFYRASSESDSAANEKPEFIMPAPFMHDANGNRSDEVHYTFESMGNGNYIFSVDADPEWINAPARVFPVCIDPQLLTNGSSCITVSHTKYQWCECYNGCYSESEWVESGYPYFGYIYLYNNGQEKVDATLHIKSSDIDLTRNKLISAKLIFEKYTTESYSGYATIKIGNKSYTHYDSDSWIVDISDQYAANADAFDLEMRMMTAGGSRKLAIPALQIEYQPINSCAIKKSFAVENGVTAELDVLSGNGTLVFDDISDPTLGVSVSHVYKPGNEFGEYGKNFRLNLDERLEKISSGTTGAQYTYTDAHGDKHTFDEHFYRIGSSGEKVYITSDISSIDADTDGRLWLNGAEVFRELTTDRGLKASSRLDGVNNAEWVEQRMDEEKQVEEQIKAYTDTLSNFVWVTKKNGEITKTLTKSKLASPDLFEEFMRTDDEDECTCTPAPTSCLLSKEEAIAFKSLLTQGQSLSATQDALVTQELSLKDHAKSLLLQLNATETLAYQRKSQAVQREALRLEKKTVEYQKESDPAANANDDDGAYDPEKGKYYADQIALIGLDNNNDNTKAKLISDSDDIIDAQEKELKAQKEHIRSQIRNFPELSGSFPELSEIEVPTGTPNGTLTRQHYNAKAQHQIAKKQEADVNRQINLYIEKGEKYVAQLKSYYKEYLSLKNQLDTLKMQIPVAYLISDSTVKGFNAKGHLVIVQDKYGDYMVVEREKYTASGATRISAVHDKDGRSMRFLYNESNKLSQICNSLGERTGFHYGASDRLVGIEREHLPALTVSYTAVSGIDRIHKVASSNETSATLSYNLTGMLKGITRSTTVSGISHDSVTTGSDTTLSTVAVNYTPTDTKLTYDSIKQEIYKIDQTREQVDAHYEIVNGLVTNAELYTYSNYLLTKTEHADKSCLNRCSYANFASEMVIGTVENVTYNSFKEPVLAETAKYAVPRTEEDSPIEQTVAEYTYNDDRKLTKVKTTQTYAACRECGDVTVAVEKYYYNNEGDIVRKESYVEGEELKTGVNIEEHVYNEQGVEIQSVAYNSLDPSSKFYTENEVDKSGRTLASFDASGEHKTAFDYDRDGVSVKTERLPNGSKLSYGRAKDGTVTAITQSTENGEENSTTQLRTLDAVTEVKSGNNTVRYEYDKKRRVAFVSLNGVDDYVTYTYSGEHTNAETVTATMADGTEATCVKDLYGNVTSSTVGDRSVANTYDQDQQLTETVDSVSGTTTLAYDGKGNVTTVTAPDHTETFAYDEVENTLDSKTINGNGISHTYQYGYKLTAARELDCIIVNGRTVRPATDALGRNTGKTIEVGDDKIAEERISYLKLGDHATGMPSTVRYASNVNGRYAFNESIQYRYDSMGNIIEVFENGRSACRYEYDALGRLTREDNVAFGKTTTWAYDSNGNIIARYEYAITATPTSELHLLSGTCVNYAYDDNSDQLLSYGDEVFVYDDTIGNPTTYRGRSATWAYGRQLTGLDGNTFTYDARGRRTGKNDIVFTYDSNGNLIKQSNGMEFFYDHTGIFAVKYNGSTYFYRKNAQQDVIALLDSSGAVVVKYNYDAWGNCNTTVVNSNASMLAVLNPFRYRSYYYDIETGLYFLKTRYYDPVIGRFMTIDDISYLDPESINGLNLYAYCLDNPVMMIDGSGCTPEWLQWLVSGISLVGGVVLCFVPGARAIGVSLIVAGATSMTSNILSAAGFDGKVASIVTNALSIVGGIVLCFTPFAAIGASMIGSGAVGIAGGYISEALGGSFELGSAIGNIVGGIIGDGIYRGLQSIGKAGVYVKLRDLKYNPKDDFIKLGPSDKALSYWRRMLSQNPRGYNTIPNMDGEVEVIKIIKHTDNMLANGHHRIYILRTLNNAPKYIKVFFTK